MSNTTIVIDWKINLKCKQCWEFKEINSDNWYKHNQWFMWVLWRCRNCIKEWRKTEKELVMSRIRDRYRFHYNEKRRKFIFKSSIERRKRKWYWPIHEKSYRKIKYKIRPTKCSCCLWEIDWNNILRIIFHHPNYNNPYKWVFCCDVCHSKIHQWKINCEKYIIDLNN